jgi:hypothetical protein
MTVTSVTNRYHFTPGNGASEALPTLPPPFRGVTVGNGARPGGFASLSGVVSAYRQRGKSFASTK